MSLLGLNGLRQALSSWVRIVRETSPPPQSGSSAQRATHNIKKFPPLLSIPQRTIVSGQLTALIGAGFELLTKS